MFSVCGQIPLNFFHRWNCQKLYSYNMLYKLVEKLMSDGFLYPRQCTARAARGLVEEIAQGS